MLDTSLRTESMHEVCFDLSVSIRRASNSDVDKEISNTFHKCHTLISLGKQIVVTFRYRSAYLWNIRLNISQQIITY